MALRFPFQIGPQSPQIAPEEEAAARARLNQTFERIRARSLAASQPQPSGMADQVVETSRGLAEQLVGRPAQQPVAPTTADTTPGSDGLWKNRIKAGWQGLIAGSGAMIGSLSRAAAGVTAGEMENMSPAQLAQLTNVEELEARAQQYGDQVRQRAQQRRMDILAQVDPEGWLEEAEAIIAEQVPLMVATAFLGGGVSAAAKAVGFGRMGSIVAGTAGAMPVIYPTMKASLQTELEQEGATRDEADMVSALVSIPAAATEGLFETVVGSRLAGRLAGIDEVVGAGLKKTLANRALAVLRSTGEGMIGEGFTEALQESQNIAAVMATTGKDFTFEELSTRIGMSALAGAVAGGAFGGGFETVGQTWEGFSKSAQEEYNKTLETAARAAAVGFDATAVEPGTTVAGKRKTVNKAGRVMWHDVATNKLTKAPTAEDVEADLLSQIRAADAAVGNAAATAAIEPLDVSVPAAVRQMLQVTGREVSPEVAELNVRRLSTNFVRRAASQIRNLSPAEIASEKAQLEHIALDPNSNTSYAARVTALARKRALEYKERASPRSNVENLDTTQLSRRLASLDGETFQRLASSIDATGGELQVRALNEARAFRSLPEDQRVESQAQEVQTLMREARAKMSRGLAPESQVATADGKSGTVLQVHPSGFVDVDFEGELITVNPSDLVIQPRPKQKAQLATGEVVTVQEVNDKGVRVTLPSGNDTTIQASEIERVDSEASAKAPMAAEQASQQAPVSGSFVSLPAPTQLVDERTGKSVTVVAISQTEAQLADGSTVPASSVGLADASNLASEIAQTKKIPVFQPGTQPAAGRHVLFLQLPDRVASAFEAKLKRGANAGATYAQAKLLPPPPKPGTRTYAIEVPAEARTLTPTAKRVLGFLSGKTDVVPKNTLDAQVEIANLPLESLGVSVVPDALMQSVVDYDAVKGMDTAQRRDYVRRLADLNFDMPLAVAEALQEATAVATEARDARIAGRIGDAEAAEVQAIVARAEVAQRVVEDDIANRQKAWKAVEAELVSTLTPKERSALAAYNVALVDDLQLLPGIGPDLAAKIVQQRKKQGGRFETIADLQKVKGLGSKTLAKTLDAAANMSERGLRERISTQREKQLKQAIAEMPGRRAGDINAPRFSFSHPTVPGLQIVIDKEIIQTARPTGRRINSAVLASAAQNLDPAEFADLSSAEFYERPIYHIKYILGDQEIHARTIGSEISNVMVPAHLAMGQVGIRGYADSPPAILRLNNAARQGGDLDAEVEAMRAERGQARQVKLRDTQEAMVKDPRDGKMKPASELPDDVLSKAERGSKRDAIFTVVQEAQTRTDELGTPVQVPMIVQDSSGERFEVSPAQVSDEVGMTDEPLVPVGLPRRLSESEALSEVVREVSHFGTKARVMGVGEWVSQVPGVYGIVRRAGPGWQAQLWEEPVTRVRQRPIVYDVRVPKDFDTQAAAEAWLIDKGFSQNPIVSETLADFPKLPRVEDVTDSNVYRIHDRITKILSIYHAHGFIPQPVRDYATNFADKWHSLKVSMPGGVFSQRRGSGVKSGRPIRRMLNLFDTQDSYKAITNTRDAAGQTVQMSPDLAIEAGKIVVAKHSPADLENDVRVIDGELLMDHIPATDPAKLQTAKALWAQEAYRDRDLDLAGTDMDHVMSDAANRLVEIGPERRLGLIVDSKPGSNDAVVQVFEGNEVVLNTVAKSDYKRVRSPDKARDYYRAYKDSMGEMTNLPSTPAMGLSPLDQKMGLTGIQDPAAYQAGLGRYIKDNLAYAQVAEDGNLQSPQHVKNLVDAWIRMKELGLSQKGMPEDQRIPPALLGTKNNGLIVSLAYDELRNTYSSISPYGDLVARAKLGLLPVTIQNQIDKQAKLFKIESSLPTWQKVEQLIQSAWDPAVAHQLYQMRRDVGAVKFIGDVNFDILPHGLELRIPSAGSTIQMNELTKYLMFPRTAANRHGTIKIFHTLAEKARTLSGNAIKQAVDLIKGAQALGSGMSLKRKLVIWDLLVSEKLGDAQWGPGQLLTQDEIEGILGKDKLPQKWDWYRQYRTMRSLLIRYRRKQIRNALVRGFHAEPINFGKVDPNDANARQQLLKKDYSLSDDEMRAVGRQVEAGFTPFNLDRTSNPAYARPRDEVESFLDLTEKYQTLEKVPEAVRATMAKSKDGWQITEFDFWARFGIHNYGPKIMQGRHVVKNEHDEIVAMAPDYQTAEEFVFRAKRGEVKVPGSSFYFEYRRALADDIDMEFLGARRMSEAHAVAARIYSGKTGKAAKLMRELNKALHIGGERATPRNIHLQPREADMADIIEDPYERILIYAARTDRNNFLLDIEHAYWTARELDPAISRATGMDAIFPSKQFGEMGHDPAQFYLDNLRDSYMGRPTEIDKAINTAIAMMEIPAKKGRQGIGRILARLNTNGYHLWADPEFLDALYNSDYASRKWAERMSVFQSVWRLGLNFAGAAINATQHMMFSPAYMVQRGVAVDDAIKYSTLAYADAVSAWRGNKELQDFLEAAGTVTVPMRGGSGSAQGGLASRPAFFSEDSLWKQAKGYGEWAMMLPFAGAERLVRTTATLAGKRAAEAQGLSGDAAVAYARDLVDNTQFQYYDQALPPFMRGSGARVLFQFQQFPLNAIKFELDMLKGMATGKFQGQDTTFSRQLGAWMLFNATGVAAGGLAWQVSRPFLALLGLQGEEWLMNKLGRGEERADSSFGTNVGDQELGSAWNAMLYGVPGLLGLQLSGRLGVSGLDLNPARLTDLAFGPSGSMYADLIKVGNTLRKTDPSAAKFLGVSALVLARYTGLPLPAAALMAQQGSQALGLDQYNRMIAGTPSGQQFINSMSPTWLRGVEHTIDIFADESMSSYDANFQKRTYPGAFNASYEAATRLIGFQTIRTAEERALLQFKFKDAEEQLLLRDHFIDAAATAAIEGAGVEHTPAVNEIIKQSVDASAQIDYDDIRARIAERQLSPVDAANARAALRRRTEGRNNPSYER